MLVGLTKTTKLPSRSDSGFQMKEEIRAEETFELVGAAVGVRVATGVLSVVLDAAAAGVGGTAASEGAKNSRSSSVPQANKQQMSREQKMKAKGIVFIVVFLKVSLGY